MAAHLPVGGREVEARAVVLQVAAQAQAAIRSGRSAIEVHLEPPELGRIRVRVISGSEGVTARLEASAPAVREILEANLPSLRQALAQAGLDVDRFSVSVGPGQHQWEQPHPQTPRFPDARAHLGTAQSPEIESASALAAAWGEGRLIDAFA